MQLPLQLVDRLNRLRLEPLFGRLLLVFNLRELYLELLLQLGEMLELIFGSEAPTEAAAWQRAALGAPAAKRAA